MSRFETLDSSPSLSELPSLDSQLFPPFNPSLLLLNSSGLSLGTLELVPPEELLVSFVSEGVRAVVVEGFAVVLHVVVVDVVVVPKISSQLSASLKHVEGPDLQPTQPVSSM